MFRVASEAASISNQASLSRTSTKPKLSRAGFARRQRGVTAIEYTIIAAMIAVAGLLGFQALGKNVSGVFSTVANAFTGSTDSSASAATPSGDAETGGGHGNCSDRGAERSGGQCSRD